MPALDDVAGATDVALADVSPVVRLDILADIVMLDVQFQVSIRDQASVIEGEFVRMREGKKAKMVVAPSLQDLCSNH